MFTSPVVEMNRELASQIDLEVHENPQHPLKGKIVGIASGRIVTVGDSLDEVCDSRRKIEPDNTRTYVLETGLDYSQTEYIWEMRSCPAPVALCSGISQRLKSS